MRQRPLRQSLKIRPSSPLTPSRNFPMTLPAISKAFLRRRSPRARMPIANRQSPLLRKSQRPNPSRRLLPVQRRMATCRRKWRVFSANFPLPATADRLTSVGRQTFKTKKGAETNPCPLSFWFCSLAYRRSARNNAGFIRRGRLFHDARDVPAPRWTGSLSVVRRGA